MNENKIKQLDEKTISLIAAGEVVENPASIVKELIENSIDARASNVVLEIKDGGKTYIRVTDDGIGINEEDIELAFERHTTSKIASLADFCTLSTNGFRGEALASIAAVSKVSITTKTKDDFLGTTLVIKGGIIEKKEKVGAKDGTTIIIEDLLYNTPARKNFLKSNQAETSKINDIVEKLALINKSIKFKYINNSKIILTTLGNTTFSGTMNNIYKNTFETSIAELPIEYIGNYGIEGFLGDNSIMAHNRKNQYVFVNKRVVKSKLITSMVEEAYSQFITVNRFPVFLINLNIDPAFIDVNIHPNKLEVKFSNENELREVLFNHIKSKLSKSVMIPKLNLSSKYKKSKKDELENINLDDFIKDMEFVSKDNEKIFTDNIYVITDDFLIDEGSKTSVDNIVKKENIQNNIYINESLNTGYFVDLKSENNIEQKNIDDIDISNNIENVANQNIFENSKYKFNYVDLYVIGVFINSYIITQYEESLYLIDQHAAHERILYEKYLNSYRNNKISSQILLMPISFNIPFNTSVYTDDIINLLNDYGFEAEIFSQESIVIRAIPNIFSQNEAINLANELINSFSKQDYTSDELKEKIASKACKSAVKASDKLLEIEISQILKNLDLCKNKYSCPHGRPITIEFSKYELEKMFKRIV